jgi:DNA polymerase phi
MKEAPQHLAVVAFSQNMVRCLMNQLIQKERFLHRMAERTLKAIEVKAASEPSFAVAAVNGLIGPYGDINFDKLTKTRTIERLLAESNLEALDAITEIFLVLINDMVGDEKATASKRRMLADYLVSALRSRLSQAPTSDFEAFHEYAMKVFVLLGHFGFFIDPSLQPPFPPTTQEMFRSRFTSCLNGLTSSHPGFIYDVIDMIHRRREGDSTYKFYIDLDQSSAEALDQAWKTLGKIIKKVHPLTFLYKLLRRNCPALMLLGKFLGYCTERFSTSLQVALFFVNSTSVQW